MPTINAKPRIVFFSLMGALFALLSCQSAETNSDRTGSETHWLSRCDDDSDCDQGVCLCGVCSSECNSGDACDSYEACVSSGSLAYDTQCASRTDTPSEGGLCLPSCDRRCGDDERCADGACVVDPEVASPPCDGDGGCPSALSDGNRVIDVFGRTVDKVDLLFVIDNSISMADKQDLFAEAVPDLVARFTNPPCVSAAGASEPATGDGCPPGFARQYPPVQDLHVGVITSSLGGFGAALDCTDAEQGDTDNAHLLGSLPRVVGGGPEFLSWCVGDSAANGDCVGTPESASAAAFADAFENHVMSAGEFGCGWEATLEAWYRFLVEPFPWTQIERQNCPYGGDMNQLCIGPALTSRGEPQVDTVLLEQRARFLRPDSLLGIVMLSDENDCSFKAHGQSWRLSQTRTPTPEGGDVANKAYKGTSTCATDPNSECCHSCGVSVPPAGCPTATNSEGTTVGTGCEEARYLSIEELLQMGSSEPTLDAVNLRCFNQKQRFGVEYLYPVSRYVNALRLTELCPSADDLDPASEECRPEDVVPNPIYTDFTFEQRRMQDPNALPIVPRSSDVVFLTGIVGVPWQDLAVDPDASTLAYQEPGNIDWRMILGSETKGQPYSLIDDPPTDPLMHEQVEARTGAHPVTGESISVSAENSINGHDWNVIERDNLQFACTFALSAERVCPGFDDPAVASGTAAACDCTFYGDESYQNPLCNGSVQTHAKAYPSIRQLEVLRDLDENATVASICPKQIQDTTAADYGYRPAIAAMMDRIAPQLAVKCLPRTLPVDADGNVECQIVEARLGADGCDRDEARAPVSETLAADVRASMEATNLCSGEADCARFELCEIEQLIPGTSDHESCLSEDATSGNGFCYIDPSQGLGDESQVSSCPAAERRRIRFVGSGAPRAGGVTFLSCG